MNIFKIPVHPAAEVFPMIDVDELQELAADIAENGLREPLVVGTYDGKQVLVDGRNRRKACEIAKVEPTYRELNGEDPVTFILSVNINRRHLTKGQRAMAVAKLYPDPKKLKRKGGSLGSKELSEARISQARCVMEFAPALADSVMSGSKSLDDAYAVAQESKRAAASDEARLLRIRAANPKLADRVVEGELTLVGAEADIKERALKEQAQILGHNLALRELVRAAKYIDTEGERKRLKLFLDDHGDLVSADGNDVKKVRQILKIFHKQLGSIIE